MQPHSRPLAVEGLGPSAGETQAMALWSVPTSTACIGVASCLALAPMSLESSQSCGDLGAHSGQVGTWRPEG